jgi:toxin ParE1/3/4
VANEIRIQSQARSDIVELAVYIGRDSVRAANRFLDATDETFAMLAQQPFLGAEYPTSNPRLTGIRVFRVKKFPNRLAFYFAREDGIEVIRVLHGARDLDAALDA